MEIFKKFYKKLGILWVLSISVLITACNNSSTNSVDGGKIQNGMIIDSSVEWVDEDLHLPKAPGTEVLENDKVAIDASNSENGYLMIRVKDLNSGKYKVIISKGEEEYVYNLTGKGYYEVYPLQMGDGEYEIKIYENINEDNYRQIFNDKVSIEMPDHKSVFVYPSQYIWYDNGDAAIDLSNEITKGIEDDVVKIDTIYNFVVDFLEYDDYKAETVEKGYLPDIEEIIKARKGICFDYSALFASMLRAQDIPVELVIGYVEPEGYYHAWNQVYIDGSWYLFDTTFGPTDDHSIEDYLNDRVY